MTQDNPSEYDRLFYPYLFAGGTADISHVLAQVQQSTLQKCQEVIELRRTTLANQLEQIVAAGISIAEAFAAGATLLAFGNGGSSTDAQDLVAELLIPPLLHAQPLPAIALTDDIAVITAVGNDVGFDNIFARQVIAFGQAGDIAVGISTSGNSTNVLVGLEQAKKRGLLTIALLGYDGGKTAQSWAVDHPLVVCSDYVPRIQEVQATMYHALLDVVYTYLADLNNTAELRRF